MTTVALSLERAHVLPVVVIDDAAASRPMAEALIAGGIPCAEITLRTPAGMAAIRAAAAVDGFLVGAGTVLTVEQVDQVVEAGARFIVSPGLDPAVLDRAREAGILAIPGVATPSEVIAAIGSGLELLKLFPADVLGGIPFLEALAGPFPDVRFVPSGGVSMENAAAYLRTDSVAAVSGSWVTPRHALRCSDFALVERLARGTVARLAL